MTPDPFDLVAVILPDETVLDWQDRAACATTDPDLFFPEKGGDRGVAAKKICAGCEVRQQCLTWSLQNDEHYGIWGELAEHDRRKLRKANKGAAA
ncbi:WhiB family transcriptional regulator [Leifsonia sp. ZF2019]|uniref:WhiB family transcriptional regulator n=1 Tax=Leifsonia sp. ZF2019 TaxID=2781978 RepID=UPI001CBD4916|nr:WhiB family transcriptional regulator [Leifsonia sp. ZF2019]UAJ79978.1 WhiB family transcriptional regulator [Leifsonia sp. ZF2019]